MPKRAATKSPAKLAVVRASTPRRGKQNVDSTQARINEQRAIDLKLAGMTFREIGDALGVHHSTAQDYVDRVLTYSAEQRENLEKLRELELQRLDKMQSRLWARVLAGDHAAGYLLLKIMERRARYAGLDAPVRQEISGPGGGPIDISLSAREDLKERIELMAGRTEEKP